MHIYVGMVLEEAYKILKTEETHLNNEQRRHRIPKDVLIRQIEQMEFPELDEAHRTLIVGSQGKTLAKYGYCS